MPRPNADGTRAITPQGRPDAQLAATATPGTSVPTVRQGRGGQRYPRADASHYLPAPGRARDRLSIRYPYCESIHLGRLRPGTAPGGPRRTPCGKVFVVVRRTYAPRATEARAA